jgi:hypothetical protein
MSLGKIAQSVRMGMAAEPTEFYPIRYHFKRDNASSASFLAIFIRS